MPRLRSVLTAATLLLYLSVEVPGSDMAVYSLCDVHVLYLFDEAESIDWPTLYYLNDDLGCRIDLLSIKPREVFQQRLLEITDKEIFLHEYCVPESDPAWIDSIGDRVCQKRRPDIVLLDGAPRNRLFGAVSKYFTTLTPASDRLFDILKIYERAVAVEDDSALSGRVVLNGNELLNRYRERMEREIPKLFPWFEVQNMAANKLVSYRLVKSSLPQEPPGAGFLSGISQMRLAEILQQRLDAGPKKQALVKHAQRFVSSFKSSEAAAGRTRVDLVADGRRQLRALSDCTDFGETLEPLADFRPYLQNLSVKAEKAAIDAVGLTWQGKLLLRDSPHGPRLKFLASLSVNGPREIELSRVRFHPYWDTTAVVLDSVSRTIMPHQSYVREYLIDMDRSQLESEQPESLLFTAEVACGQMSLVFSNSFPLWEKPKLQVRFEPDYYFMPLSPELEVDRVVSSMTLRAVISKPRRYSGAVHLDLETPRGLFAGAYRQDIQLDEGTIYQTVRIPFSISNLFELGIQPLFLTITAGGKVVAADTAQARIADCHVADTIKVGLMPNSSGTLEDVLRMTDAGFQPLTDRTLMTADLGAYNVIVIDSGSFRHYPSFNKLKGRFEDYLRHGGSIVVMGQPDDWPQGAVPISIVPTMELVDRAEINNAISEARMLSKPYDISPGNLLSFFNKKRGVASAVVSPAEKVFVTPSGGTLLSVTRLGEGQIIYCGFPLLEMISELNIDAIHLLANILNY